MKTIKLFILLLVSALTAHAQTADKMAILKKAITLLDSAKSNKQYTHAAGYFEQIADASQQQWLTQYYAGYSTIMTAITSEGTMEAKDALYNKAMGYVNKADALTPNNSEVYVLKGYITFMKMSVDPQVRAMQMIPEADDYLAKAVKLNPENPRAYLIRGQNFFYTPQMFGGGKDVAKPLLITGTQKFAAPLDENFMPTWGKVRCAVLLQACK
jgi:tetratricopeptide (TPR) repeat protein